MEEINLAEGAEEGNHQEVQLGFRNFTLWEPPSFTSPSAAPASAPLRLQVDRRRPFCCGSQEEEEWEPRLSNLTASLPSSSLIGLASTNAAEGRSLFNLLAGIKNFGEVSGEIYVSRDGGQDLRALEGKAAFLGEAFGSLLRNLTVREYLVYAALNRSFLPYLTFDFRSVSRRVTSLLAAFQLQDYANVLIGDWNDNEAAGLSRMNQTLVLLLAELAGNPLILFAENLFAQLSSSEAFTVASLLKKVASRTLAIIQDTAPIFFPFSFFLFSEPLAHQRDQVNCDLKHAAAPWD